MKKIVLLSTALLLLMACQPSDQQAVSEKESISERFLSDAGPRSATPVDPDQEIEYPAQNQGELSSESTPSPHRLSAASEELKTNRPVNLPLEVIPELAAQEQVFMVDGQKGRSFRGAKGTYLQIPPEAFVDAQGRPVSGPVEFRLKESMSRLELIAGGLSTQADDQLLYSGGVVNLEAYADGQKLELAPGAEILVEFPEVSDQAEMRLWYAERDAEGYLNWKDEAQAQGNMILLPFESLGLTEISLTAEQDSLLNAARKERGVWQVSERDRLQEKLAESASQESWLATREFKQRLVALKNLVPEYEMLTPYLANQNKDLWKADQKVLEDLRFVRRTMPKHQDASKVEQAIATFERFVAEKKARAEVLPDLGIDLGHPDAYRQLRAKGVEPVHARRYVQVYACSESLAREEEVRRKQEAAARERSMANAATSNAVSLAYESPNVGKQFSVLRLGSLNNDGPLGPINPTTMEVPVLAKNEKVQNFSRCFLVLTGGQKSFLELRRQASGDFLGREVPRNKKAFLFALSYVDGQYYMGSRSIRTHKGREDGLAMAPVSMDQLTQSLKTLQVVL